MKRRLLAAVVLLLAAFPLRSQDRDLMLGSCPARQQEVAVSDSTNFVEKLSGAVGRQLGHQFFTPPNYLFFRQAVRELGFFRAVAATLDRMQRASRLGTMHAVSVPVDEGPEAYLPGRRRR